MTGPLPTLPVGPLDLLVKAALAPPDIAREAWRTWRRGYLLDETPWNEVRLLGAVAERIDWLEPDAEIVPRMKGIQKFLYAQTQLCLSGCTGGLKALAAAGIPMMLIKGAARVAADGRVARQRLVRDLDLLVPFADRFRAFATLWEAGWRFKANGAWQLAWHRMDSTANHHAWSLSSDAAEIDLHHFSNSLNRRTGDDDGLWRRARETQWRGLPLRLPDASDGLVLGIVHGLRWSQECNADWLIDVTASLDTGHVDWDLVVADAARREVQEILLHGLAYIRDVLHRDVPQPVLDHLAAGATGLQRDELAVYAAVPMPRDADQNAAMLAMAVQRCGAPGEGQAPGASGVLELPAARLPAQTAVTVASFVPEGDAARLTIRMPASPGAQLVATLCIMGLVIDARTGVAATGDAGGAFQAFHFSVPRQLVERRGAKRLCLTVTPAARARFAGERCIEHCVEEAGGVVFRPETATIAEQMTVYRTAGRLIFSQGSALAIPQPGPLVRAFREAGLDIAGSFQEQAFRKNAHEDVVQWVRATLSVARHANWQKSYLSVAQGLREAGYHGLAERVVEVTAKVVQHLERTAGG